MFNWEFPYSSQRMPVMARNVVATSQPLASQAGLSMLQRGGTAADAAIAAAITLTVVEPTMNGIGSDAFAVVWDGRKLHGLNGSGRSPAAWHFEHFTGYESMPQLGWGSVTVPGAVSTWVEISRRFGRLPFEALFEPALGYASDGFLVTPMTARLWNNAAQVYKDFPEFIHTFLPDGRAPGAGENFVCPSQAETLQRIAETRGEAFYEGDLAERIISHAKATGGLMSRQDLAAHRADWVEPLSIGYRGVQLHEIPPNGQGIAALLMLGILEHWNMQEYPADSPDSLHLQIEAMKLAFADTYRYVSDPSSMDIDFRRLLEPAYLSERARLVSLRRAREVRHGVPAPAGETVYLTAADSQGMMVSFIQSNYMGFGSGIVIPGTGISLQNRGAGFVLKRNHPNAVAGVKRPFHTIVPAFVTRGKEALMSFGVMGGPMQPQGHGQLMIRIFDYHQNPQAACDAPRWQVLRNGEVAFEPGFRPAVLEELRRRGHEIRTEENSRLGGFGGAQVICRLTDGYCGASDPRKDGQAVGF